MEIIIKYNNEIKRFSDTTSPYVVYNYINECVDKEYDIYTNSYLLLRTIKDRCNRNVYFLKI